MEKLTKNRVFSETGQKTPSEVLVTTNTGRSKQIVLTFLVVLMMTFTLYLDYRFVSVWSTAKHLTVKEHFLQGVELILLLAWMEAHMPGFSILEMDLSNLEWFFMNRNDRRPKISAYLVRGLAKVTDIQAAQRVLEQGIGRAKGFGFGMLMIVPERAVVTRAA